MSATHSSATPSVKPRRPPRPPMMSRVASRSPKMQASVRAIDYPHGKNPFGDSDSDSEAFRSIHWKPLNDKVKGTESIKEKEGSEFVNAEILAKNTHPPRLRSRSKNPFDSDDENEEDPVPSAKNGKVQNQSPSLPTKLVASISSDEKYTSCSSLPHAESKNPFGSDDEDQEPANTPSDPKVHSVRLKVPPEIPARSFKKRAAPLPPETFVTCSMEHLQTQPASPIDSHYSSSRSTDHHHIPSGTAAPGSRTPSLYASSELSLSSESVLNGQPRSPTRKKLAPPQPVPEKREVHSEGLVNFVEYSLLRRKIEEFSRRLSNVLADITSTQAKLNSSEADPSKHSKYKKRLERLKEKQRVLAEKQHGLTNQLQRQTLEDRHADLEHELRTLMAKQEHLRTPEDKAREQECLNLLLEIVERRAQLTEDQDACDPHHSELLRCDDPTFLQAPSVDDVSEFKKGTLLSASHLFKKPPKITFFNGKANKKGPEEIPPDPISS